MPTEILARQLVEPLMTVGAMRIRRGYLVGPAIRDAPTGLSVSHKQISRR